MKQTIKILAIETSCDETAAAVIGEADEISNSKFLISKRIQNSRFKFPKIMSNVVSSQVDLHAKTGGIVPEVASRAHMESILPVIEEALLLANSNARASMINQTSNSPPMPRLRRAGKFQNKKFGNLNIEHLLGDITHIAVTNGPGLIGSLLVGFNAAKTIAYVRNLPLIPINHIEGHIYSAFSREFSIFNFHFSNKSQIPNSNTQKINSLQLTADNFPVLALTVSGGHTSLALMKNHGEYETIGETIDDAAGEAFDKVAKLLGLGYPGGPVVSKFASEFRNKTYNLQLTTYSFPRPLLNKPNFDFSFSGLKTAVLTKVLKMTTNNRQLTTDEKEQLCFAFEEAVVDVLATKTLRAAKKFKPRTVILAGGVAANSRLREELSLRLKTYNLVLLMPPIELCGDNAAMIGLAAYYHIVSGESGDWRKAKVDANLEL